MATTPLPHRSTPPVFCLLDAGADFADAVGEDDALLARRALTLPTLMLPRGRWDPAAETDGASARASLLVVDGAVVRQVSIAARTSTQFAGPGDILDPWTNGDDLLGCATSWSVHRPTTAVVLDERFALACRRWPKLAEVVVARLSAQLARAATMTAIGHLPRVELRILAFLWHVADLFGRVGRDGIAVDLDLTHELIGQAIGARRPTVTLAVRALAEDGLVRRRSDGLWTVSIESREMLHEHAAGDAG